MLAFWRVFVLCLLCVPFSWGQTSASGSRVEGTVFILDSQGPSYVPGAKVTLSGAVSLLQETDSQGRYTFPDVVPGAYTITAEFPGLEATESITVAAGRVAEFALELKPVELKTSVTVTETEPEVKSAAPSQTISSSTVTNAPNKDERAESVLPLVPGVVRGPDGRINMKGARASQGGALVNSANITDPATGNAALDLPVEVVQSVQVISNPYNPEYGKLTGAVSSMDTKVSNFEKFHFSIQNVMPRVRVRNGSIMGVGGATPRTMMTGPLIKDRLAVTQSLEYRFIRTPSNSLPGAQRDSTLQGVNSYTQFDINLTAKQTATFSIAFYPQKVQYLGLNTFLPQPSAPDYHQRGNQIYFQHRYANSTQSLLTSQFSYKVFDTDITPNGTDPFRLQVETTEGSFFNLQARRSTRFDWEETYQFVPRHFLGTHEWKAGFDYAHSHYDGRQAFYPVEIDNVSGAPIEKISYTSPTSASIGQNEAAAFLSDHWSPVSRLSFDAGARLDHDGLTDSSHISPRGGFQLLLTSDAKTILKGGAGVFYDRVPLLVASFPYFPDRTVSYLNPLGDVTASTFYVNRIADKLHNPRSTAWNVSLSRQITHALTLQVGYEQRHTTHDFVVSPYANGDSGVTYLTNSGRQSYREFQITGRYQFAHNTLNASYVRSRAYGDLNDFFQFYGNTPKPVIQPDGQGRLSYDAPNRVLAWGEFKAPFKLTLMPVMDVHTGFPYSVQNSYRDYVGQRNSERYPRFASVDLQVLRPITFPFHGHHVHARAGISIFNLLDHFNPRDVQNIQESARFGHFYNDAWREYRGKFVFEF
ncbi:MAG TPA: TonB-dependent receptor [Candidatus Bathyarchaeia archaeon]|nr:TonB-dependent receptor [Candidatus Bathyarchaeia archaeon]